MSYPPVPLDQFIPIRPIHPLGSMSFQQPQQPEQPQEAHRFADAEEADALGGAHRALRPLQDIQRPILQWGRGSAPRIP